MITEERVREALTAVFDPELGLNIVDLGLVYAIRIHEGDVTIEMTLTARGCPLHEAMVGWVREAVGRLEGVGRVEVKLVWDPPWTPERMSEAAREALGL